MRRMLSVAGLALLAVGIVFGGTELPSPDVTARPTDTPGFFVTNDAAHPVPVHEQGTLDVNVTNGAIPVQVVERRQPLQRDQFTDHFGTERFRSFHVEVPAGKLLVVETVSVSAVVESGQKARASVSFQGGPVSPDDLGVANHMLTLERVDGFGPGDVFATTRSITGYAGGDQGVIISVERNSATGPGGRVEFSLSGYLVDMPTTLAK